MKKPFSKKGISLILLIISIVVVVFITRTVMISIAESKPSESEIEEIFKADVEAFNNQLKFWLDKEKALTMRSLDVSTINATKTSGDYNNLKIQDIITSMSDDYASQFEIKKGKLVYIGDDETACVWANKAGIGRSTSIISDSSTFVIYYSKSDIFLREKIKQKDIAILEPVLYTKEDIEYIKSSGTVTFGYIPVSQVNVNDAEFISMLESSDYIYENGLKKTDKDGKVYITNLNSQHYIDVFLKLVKARIMDRGFDGIFIDGADYLESMYTDEDYKKCKLQYENILIRYKRQNSKALIIQNRGFKVATDISDKYIDAILWENFQSYEENVSDYEKQIIAEMKQLQNKGIKILAVSNLDSNISEENLSKVILYARGLGFTYYYSPYNSYASWPF